MPERFSRASVNLDVSAGSQPAPATPEPDTPFRILILGDFSGRANRGIRADLTGRRPKQVDLDNVEDLMTEMGVALRLPQIHLRFRELDHFHPDHIYQTAPLFQQIEDTRTQPPSLSTVATAPAAPARPAASGASLLDSMLAETDETSETDVASQPDALADFIRKIMRPHLEARPDARRQKWSAQVDQIASEQMRAVLHHPQFQAVEAAWRALWFVMQRLDPDTELKIYLLDVTLEELIAGRNDIGDCLASKDPWAVIAGLYTFGQSPQDAAVLKLMGRIAAGLGAPFIAEAIPPAAEEPEPHWQLLAASPEAKWVGLACPRFLLRLPYGRKTSPAESFDFDEMPESDHAAYLWANPALACVLLLGQSFRADAWSMRPGRFNEIEGLPLHVYQEEDGGSAVKPCAEVLMTTKEAEDLTDNGFMPLASLKERDAVLLVRFQSIAHPPTALMGRWA